MSAAADSRFASPAGCAAVLIAAPASGQGKTTVAAALARLHARRGAVVRAFKCGPDFLDPQWLALASGAPVDPLDLWINGADDCAARLAQAAREAGLIVVEGVMGLHDGAPSAADLARRFGLPVVAVIDAQAMAGTFGAVAHGLRTWRDGLPWAGVFANRVAGAGHADLLEAATDPESRWLGALARDAAITLPERHLGLVGAAELPDAMARIDAAADALSGTPLGRRPLADWPRWTPPVAASAALGAGAAQPLAGCRIAVARDAAFSFVYAANLALLQSLGATTTLFSPLAGDALPACDALWLPGGYPELHAPALAAQQALRAQVVAHAAAGKPVWAECGGMMALVETLVDVDGRAHPMWGLLPGTVTMGRRLAALGSCGLTIGGDTLRGHSFHYASLATTLQPLASTHPPPAAIRRRGAEGFYQAGSVRASWFHPWFPSSPALTARLFGAAALT